MGCKAPRASRPPNGNNEEPNGASGSGRSPQHKRFLQIIETENNHEIMKTFMRKNEVLLL